MVEFDKISKTAITQPNLSSSDSLLHSAWLNSSQLFITFLIHDLIRIEGKVRTVIITSKFSLYCGRCRASRKDLKHIVFNCIKVKEVWILLSEFFQSSKINFLNSVEDVAQLLWIRYDPILVNFIFCIM